MILLVSSYITDKLIETIGYSTLTYNKLSSC